MGPFRLSIQLEAHDADSTSYTLILDSYDHGSLAHMIRCLRGTADSLESGDIPTDQQVATEDVRLWVAEMIRLGQQQQT